MKIQNGWLIVDRFTRIRLDQIVRYSARSRGAHLYLADGTQYLLSDGDESIVALLDAHFQPTP